ncbi:hypothetical protein RJ40_06880 [Methanofollis aquaemaris]|uniref:Uncharacterized protein n=1 Tax=Methanofollis aquaemaris TaxID=126734 RepID=A0A8A3S5P7_9EURY|nr:hypothetical protein [Methanofollis aquaemaris]QSZ67243.1 hypothetical protein RJ40_06880 [Methanofollis aquaemaris]
MKQIFWIALLLAGMLLACGCTEQGTAPQTPTPTPTATATVTPTPNATATVTPAASLPVELSSSSPYATLSLDAGVLFVSFHAEEAQKMEINFANATQGFAEMDEFSMTGPYNGSVVYEIPQKDEYLLNISGTGAWTAEASRYVPGEGLKAPLNLTGTGTEVPSAVYLEQGQYVFERNETGEASPLYIMRHANGSYLMDANLSRSQTAFGVLSTETSKNLTISESGTYILSVIASENPAPWSVSISPANESASA